MENKWQFIRNKKSGKNVKINGISLKKYKWIPTGNTFNQILSREGKSVVVKEYYIMYNKEPFYFGVGNAGNGISAYFVRDEIVIYRRFFDTVYGKINYAMLGFAIFEFSMDMWRYLTLFELILSTFLLVYGLISYIIVSMFLRKKITFNFEKDTMTIKNVFRTNTFSLKDLEIKYVYHSSFTKVFFYLNQKLVIMLAQDNESCSLKEINDFVYKKQGSLIENLA